jgi:hypothetical protein
MSASNVKKKLGRPTIYTPELTERICAELACGKSLRTVCKSEDMPGLETVFRWLREMPAFRDQYVHAKNESADALVEEMLDIADDGSNDWMEQFDKDGNSVGWKLNGEHVQRSRLRVDTRKWVASKLKPKKYGDAVDLNHGGQTENPFLAMVMAVQGSVLRPVPQRSIALATIDHDDTND